eukprot:GEZU01024611.1.p1 GENE.GEZU01024611.1~~GEZU01024611.1.p1  ORF type:complete len:216 (+),score=66.37 GEZU01024611.1:202-849(+)
MGYTEIFFWAPNLIGYARVALALISYVIAFDSPLLFSLCYLVSFLADAVDGYAARALGQSSRFGAVLDMVTDRFGTAGLVLILSHLYPKYITAFIFLNVLDFVSHWMRMYSHLLRGQHHKKTDQKHFWLLRVYYDNRTVLGALCLGNELFYYFLYAAHFFSESTVNVFGTVIPVFQLLACVAFVPFATKQFINVIQMSNAAKEIANWEWVNEHKK